MCLSVYVLTVFSNVQSLWKSN